MGEVGVHQYRRVPLGPVGSFDRLTQELLYATGIALLHLVLNDAQGQDACVSLQHFPGSIRGPVIQDEEVILALEAGKYLTNLPQQEPDRGGFVVTRNTDVNHEPSREWANERYTDSTSSAMRVSVNFRTSARARSTSSARSSVLSRIRATAS